MQKFINAIFPFTFEYWRGDVEVTDFYGVEWLEDFGSIKKGTVNKCITIDYKQGVIFLNYNQIFFKCLPKNS